MLNRHTTPLPSTPTPIQVSVGSYIYNGIWYPFKPENYTKETMPSEGYLGTFRFKAPQGEYQRDYDNSGYGFHAWEQNDSEFVNYLVKSV